MSATSSDSSSSQETLEDGTEIYESDDGFTMEVHLLIEIDNDKLDLHVRMNETSKKENKGFINEESITTKISGDTYPTSHDFFLKLSELSIIRENWNYIDYWEPGYSLILNLGGLHKG